MKIVYLKLVNFIGVKAATGLNEIEFKYDHIKQPIIQLYGKNRCGKTVMIQQHHPFSSINLTGDERNDLSLIIPGEIGYKEIVYEVNGDVYHILHTYKPGGKSHTVSSSIRCNGEELNPSGGVNTFNSIIENRMGINKYVFQFIINGTNLTPFAGMGATQRKQLLNKALGIDIYDRIHKLATDDYRYTNKLITSLNHTKEYLLQSYGSYETLFATVDEKRSLRDKMDYELQQLKSKIDALSGSIQTIRSQNPESEYNQIVYQINEYQRIISLIGNNYDQHMSDQLVDEQIELNKQLSDLKAKRSIIMHDVDELYQKQHDIENTMISIKQTKSDYDRMDMMLHELEQKIMNIHIETQTDASVEYLMSMLSLAQAINTTCGEITSSLKHEHLEFMGNMILNDLDVSTFLIREGSSLMDSEKEKSVISYIRSMLQSVNGEIPDRCTIENCLYQNVYHAFDAYFQSFQSQSSGKFTQYDLEQMDHAYKNVLTIQRLLGTNQPPECVRDMFRIKSILKNLMNHKIGIDVDYIKYLIEESAKIDQRNQYIKQHTDIEQSMKFMKDKLVVDIDESIADQIQSKIDSMTKEQHEIETMIESIDSRLQETDQKRMMLTSIKNVDIVSIEKRKMQLESTINKLHESEQLFQTYTMQYQSDINALKSITNELNVLEKAFDQFVKTSSEIEQTMADDQYYKVIAEATSSTKGMPVIAIRNTVDKAINMANHLLDVMYDGEMTLLHPIIDETTFSLPFQNGSNKSNDIRYGSQSESTLLSLALSLSLASSLTSYNIPLTDEIDAYLDQSIRNDFIMMLETMMSTLGMEQMFMISHNLQKGQFSHIVYTMDISEAILNQTKKGGD